MLTNKNFLLLFLVGLLISSCGSDSTASSSNEPATGTEYIVSLKEARTETVISQEGALLDEFGMDRVCHDHLLIDSIGEETLLADGVTAENIGTYELEADILDEELFESLIRTCLDDIAATASLVNQVGGEEFRPVVECLISDEGEVSDLYIAVLNDADFLNQAFENGSCLDSLNIP